MSILLIVIAISFKSLCMHGVGSAFMCLMTFLVTLMIISHFFGLNILICNICLGLTFFLLMDFRNQMTLTLICSFSHAYISNMSFLTTIMTSRFVVLTFFIPFFSTFGLLSFFSTCMSKSRCVII